MKHNKGFAPIAFAIVVIVILVVGGAVYYLGKNSNTSSTNNSKSKSISITTNTACESGEIPLIQKGEQIAKQTREDLDNDGTKELMVIYAKMVPGWEGMPMPSYRFTLFTCENGRLVASYEANPYLNPFLNSFDFINYESGKAILLTRYGGGWDLLLKNGVIFEKVSPDNQRLQEFQKLGVHSSEGSGANGNILNNKIEEVIQVSLDGPPCISAAEYVKIIYEFKNHKFDVISVDGWKEITENHFKYPINWLCESNSRVNSDILKTQTYDYIYLLYPTSSEIEANAVLIDQTNMSCDNWLKTNTYKHKSCILLDTSKTYAGDRNSAVIYTNSDFQAVIDGFNLFVETNKNFVK